MSSANTRATPSAPPSSVGADDDVEMQVVASGCPHPERVPGLLDDHALARWHEEVRHRPRFDRLGRGPSGDEDAHVRQSCRRDKAFRSDGAEPALDWRVGRREARRASPGSAFAHRHRVERTVRGRPQGNAVPGIEVGRPRTEPGRERVGGLCEGSGHRRVHVVDECRGPAGPTEHAGDPRVLDETRPRAPESLRHHQREQAAVSEVVEVASGKATGPVALGRPSRDLRRSPSPPSTPCRRRVVAGCRGCLRAHGAPLIPTPWKRTAVDRVRTIRESRLR